ncbi:hypothetical protein G4B88_000774 [Cannabis sativa]|uniref:RNase H type-1 domain-containing protein n=1 Tax=Cannabis sativa TaxID=3483 RepID=A0A7J6I2V0_CANSA|nr:hypothetical protein G4B88_000774 [Cannabis sativa]
MVIMHRLDTVLQIPREVSFGGGNSSRKASFRKWQMAGHSLSKWGASTSLFAEAQALLEGLHWCTAIKIPLASIESDCLQLIPKVKSSWKDDSALSSVIELIRKSLSQFPNASLYHISTIVNCVAQHHAREALRQDKDRIWRI